MSKSGIPIVSDIAKGAGKLLKPVKDIFKPDIPDLASAAAPVPDRNAPPADPEIAKRVSEQFATREQDVQRKASAAGALRSENDADLLGYAAPKKRSASRALLG